MEINKFAIIAVIFVTAFLFIYFKVFSRDKNYIPLNVIFGDSQRSQVQISPDGTKIAYLAPSNNIVNVFVKTISKDDDKKITFQKVRGIHNFFWAFDSKYIFYTQDKDGDENYHLFKIDLANLKSVDLTPFEGVRFDLIEYLADYPNKMIVGLNKDNKSLQDVYELDLQNGQLKLLEKNPGDFSSWLVDRQLNVRGALQTVSDGGTNLVLKNDKTGKWETLIYWSMDESNTSFVKFNKKGDALFITDSRNSDTTKLIKFYLDSKTEEIIYHDPEYDIDTVFTDNKTYEPRAVLVNREHSDFDVIDENIKKDIALARQLDYGDFYLNDANLDDTKWIVNFNKDNGPMSYWLYDRQTKKGQFLFYNKPDLLKYKLTQMQPFSYHARDGLLIHGYLTYPLNKERKNLPLILNVHGGPWSRDNWGYDSEAQWMANRGYVVMQVNYRGSSGYGKSFLKAGFMQWGAKMQDDLTDAVQWAIDQGIADKNKVAIYGGSYGGYAALAGAAFTPDLYRCAVDICGVSNLLTFLDSIPPYWSVYLAFIYKAVGNPKTQKDLLIARSPLFSIDRIKIPLLVAQGANDPRVKQAEAEQIVDALKKKNIPHEYILFPDEGHGFYKAKNRIEFYKKAEKFLRKYLN